MATGDRIGGLMQAFQQQRFTMSGQPGAVPTVSLPPALEALVSTQPTEPAPDARLDIPVISKEGLTRGMGMEPVEANAFNNYVHSLLGSDHEGAFKQQVMQYAMQRGYEPALRSALLGRSVSYYSNRGVSQGNGARVRAVVRGMTPEGQTMKVDLQKSPERFTADLEKAAEGEGSRGGQVIGHTSSNKPIYASGARAPEHAGFTSQDHKDAAKAHSKLMTAGMLLDRRQDAHTKDHQQMARDKEKTEHAAAEDAAVEKIKGKKLGKTQSGKSVYGTVGHPSHVKFTAQDHRDAEGLHKEAKNSTDGKAHDLHTWQAFQHSDAAALEGKRTALFAGEPKAGRETTGAVIGRGRNGEPIHSGEGRAGKVKLHMNEGAPQEVDAHHVAGDFAVHAGDTTTPWKVSHVPSGGAILGAQSRQEAVGMAKQMHAAVGRSTSDLKFGEAPPSGHAGVEKLIAARAGLQKAEVFAMTLEKAALGGKYAKRVTGDDGKHRYFYSEEAYKKSPAAHIAGVDVLRDRLRKELRDRLATVLPGGKLGSIADLIARYGEEDVQMAMRDVMGTAGVQKKSAPLKKPVADQPPPLSGMPDEDDVEKGAPAPRPPAEGHTMPEDPGSQKMEADQNKLANLQAGVEEKTTTEARKEGDDDTQKSRGLSTWLAKAKDDAEQPAEGSAADAEVDDKKEKAAEDKVAQETGDTSPEQDKAKEQAEDRLGKSGPQLTLEAPKQPPQGNQPEPQEPQPAQPQAQQAPVATPPAKVIPTNTKPPRGGPVQKPVAPAAVVQKAAPAQATGPNSTVQPGAPPADNRTADAQTGPNKPFPPKKKAPPEPIPPNGQQQEGATAQKPPAQAAPAPQPGPAQNVQTPAQPLQKSGLDSWLQKSAADGSKKDGEGSRGGHVIGHTGAGVPIYESHTAAAATIGQHMAGGYEKKADQARAEGARKANPQMTAGDHLDAYNVLKERSDKLHAASDAAKEKGETQSHDARRADWDAKFQTLAEMGMHSAAHAALTGKHAREANDDKSRADHQKQQEAKREEGKGKWGGKDMSSRSNPKGVTNQYGDPATQKKIHAHFDHPEHASFTASDHAAAAYAHREKSPSLGLNGQGSAELHAERAYHHEEQKKHETAASVLRPKEEEAAKAKAVTDKAAAKKAKSAATRANGKATGGVAEGKVKVATRTGPQEADVDHVSGHFAVHKPIGGADGSYSVTHVPSGLSVHQGKNKDDAIAAARHMDQHVGDSAGDLKFGKAPPSGHAGVQKMRDALKTLNTTQKSEASMSGLASWMKKSGIPYTEGVSSGGADPGELQTGDPPDQGLDVGDAANGTKELDMAMGASAPSADGNILSRTGPGKETTVESTTGNVDVGGTDALSEEGPQKVKELAEGGPPLDMKTASADDIAADVANRMDVKGNGLGGLGKSLSRADPQEVRDGSRNRAIQVAALKKAGSGSDVLAGQGVAPAAPAAAEGRGSLVDQLIKAANQTTDDLVDEVMKGDGYFAQTPAVGRQNALSRKTLCKGCKQEVPEMFKSGACPSCGMDMQKSQTMPVPTSPGALRPNRNADLYLPQGVKK